LPCPPGKYCAHAGLDSPTDNCTAGYYCNEKSTVANQNICPEGRYCPEGTATPQLCPPGTFASGIGSKVLSDCMNCTAGHYCEVSGLARETGPCAARYWSWVILVL